MPNDLTALIGAQPDRLHAVVENFFRHPTHLTERFFVHPQQRAQLLVHSRFGHHPSAIAQREGAPQSFRSGHSLSSVPKWPQSTCACLPGGVSNHSTATRRAEVRWGRSQSDRIVYPPV